MVHESFTRGGVGGGCGGPEGEEHEHFYGAPEYM